MFTAFRCFTGDCNSDQGEPIASLLFHEYKLPFMICFVISYMLVAMGIFNVILAVCLHLHELQAAKETEALTAEQHARESIRIARTTRELLKKFAAFQKTFQNDSNEPVSESSMGDLNFMDEEKRIIE
ncbi:Voltage-dependent L-type calcium channel subunit alpha-1S [Durusdinium trenchii]|uniref:Voltage-dependent L-type calcium channel subunit alpha-1S n=1 Tax=Durusdinium trenchii TaxID=1381693 RepID=A0ABP0RU84_9DINO